MERKHYCVGRISLFLSMYFLLIAVKMDIHKHFNQMYLFYKSLSLFIYYFNYIYLQCILFKSKKKLK